MPIKGDLSRIDLANIFQMLTLNQNEGTLNIYYAGLHKSLYFTGNDIIMPFDRDAMEDRVLSLLMRQGKLTEEGLERARYNTSTLNTGLLGAAVQMRFTTEEDVHAAYLAQMEEDIYELFLMKDARFEFLEGEKPSDRKTMDLRFTLTPNNLLMEAVRRGDEWAHIRELVPTEFEVFERVDEGLPEGVEDSNGEFALILSAMDGVRSVGRIIEETRLHRFSVFKNCSLLMEAGKIVPIEVDQLMRRADDAIEASRTWDAIDLYERAIAAGIDDHLLFEKAGYAYKYVSEHQKAVRQFYRFCEHCEARGALKQAIKTYGLIRELVPTELVARERVFQLYLNNQELFEDEGYDLIVEGTALALICKELNRLQESQEIVQLLFGAFRENVEILEDLAKLALDIQSSSTALMILEHLGERLLAERDSANALRVFRRIKCIDPEYRGIDDKLDCLIEDDLVRRKKHSRLIRTMSLVAVFAGLFVGYFLFNSYAFKAYTKINLEHMMAKNAYKECRSEYESFCAKFPLSIYWFLAKEKLSVIESAEARYMAAEMLRSEYDAEERRNSQQNAENLYVDAMASLQSSDMATGLRLLQKAAEAAQDRAWLEENEINEMVVSLETYFERARELKEDAARLRAAGKFSEAHELLSELVSRHTHTDEAREALFPMLVTSNPAGAKVLVDGVEVMVDEGTRKAVTPAVLDLPLSAGIDIEVRKEGFMYERRTVDPLEVQELDFELRYKTESGFDVGSDLAFTPIQSGRTLLLGYRDGRIRRFDIDTHEFLWSYTVQDLKNLDSPFSVTDRHVYFCWGDGMASALSLEDGTLCWDKRLSACSKLRPLESAGAVFIAQENGRVMILDPDDGTTFLDRDLKSPVVVDPMPWGSGAVLALQDGRVLWLDSRKGETKQQRRLLASPTAACLSEDRLIIGTAQGGIECFKIDTGEVYFSHLLPSENAVTQLLAKDRYVYCVQGGRQLFSLDSSRLEVTGKFLVISEQIWLSTTAGTASIAVAESESIMYLLRAHDLSVIRKYRAEEEIEFSGLNLDDHVYFYSKDGILNGLRY